MLKKIPPILPAKLMKNMMEMGHSDILILADANFPAVTNAKRYIRADGVEIPELLEAILPFFPPGRTRAPDLAAVPGTDREI